MAAAETDVAPPGGGGGDGIIPVHQSPLGSLLHDLVKDHFAAEAVNGRDMMMLAQLCMCLVMVVIHGRRFEGFETIYRLVGDVWDTGDRAR